MLIFACHLFFYFVTISRSQVTVRTINGDYEGDTVRNSDGMEVDVFLGIQYGNVVKQFSKPEPVGPWEGVKKAKSWPPLCVQTDIGKWWNLTAGTENCLYLNLFTPHKKANEDNYPVMVFIHGGGYAFGSAVEYGMDGINNWVVPKGVIVVTFHYRLGPWGFLSTGSKEAKGNWGLWDQRLLLQWVEQNVKSFGGNPSKVTVFGESAGAFATSLLSISPHSQGLFHQAILMSGSSLAPMFFGDKVIKSSLLLADMLGCRHDSPAELLECVRSKPAEELKYALENDYHDSFVSAKFFPRFDGDFFPKHLATLFTLAPKKSFIIGTTKDEMASKVAPLNEKVNTSFVVKNVKDFTLKKFKNCIEKFMMLNDFQHNDLIEKIIIHHYVTIVGDENNGTLLMEAMIRFLSDFLFMAPANREAKLWNKLGSKVWLYSFDYFNEKDFPTDHIFKGSYHALDLNFIFQPAAKSEYSDADLRVAEFYTTMWTNFAKFGHPTPDNHDNAVKWNPISEKNEEIYLKINTDLELSDRYQRSASAFWNDLLPYLIKLQQSKNQNRKIIRNEL